MTGERAQPFSYWLITFDGTHLRRRRLERGLSQERLAYHSGVSLKTIQRIEKLPAASSRAGTQMSDDTVTKPRQHQARLPAGGRHRHSAHRSRPVPLQASLRTRPGGRKPPFPCHPRTTGLAHPRRQRRNRGWPARPAASPLKRWLPATPPCTSSPATGPARHEKDAG